MDPFFENLSHPPEGGRVKLVILGIILPGLITWYGHEAWASLEAWWPGRGRGMTVHGESARAMAMVYFSIASFVHFRWFWGVLQADRIFQAGTVLASLSFLGALTWALWAL